MFTARQKEATAWAEAGYVVAEEKLPMQTAKKPMYTATATDELTVEDGTTTITVSGPRDLAQKISKAGVYIDLDKLEMAEGTLLMCIIFSR